MTKVGPKEYLSAVNVNFKGKQSYYICKCKCCLIINDKKEKLDNILIKEFKDKE